MVGIEVAPPGRASITNQEPRSDVSPCSRLRLRVHRTGETPAIAADSRQPGGQGSCRSIRRGGCRLCKQFLKEFIVSLPTAPLGRTGLNITRVGFGSWAVGGGGWAFGWGPQDDAASLATMRHALEAGVNWIDTAAVYGLGHSGGMGG